MTKHTSDQYQPLAAKVPVVAQIMGFSDPKTVYGLIKTGKIRARKVNGTFLVSLASVREFLGEE